MPNDDEEALSWLGDDSTAPAQGRKKAAAKKRPVHEVESTTEADTILELEADEEEVAVLGSASLVVLGVLAGIYFLYALGWLTYALRSLTSGGSDPLADAMFNLGLWLAVTAAPLWFGLTFWLTHRPALRYGVLVLGALVLIPIPLVWP